MSVVLAVLIVTGLNAAARGRTGVYCVVLHWCLCQPLIQQKTTESLLIGSCIFSKISTHTKLRLYNVCILPVFLYGAKTWSITKAIERRINTLDQWCLRRILNITWSEHVTNSEVRRRLKVDLRKDLTWTCFPYRLQ